MSDTFCAAFNAVRARHSDESWAALSKTDRCSLIYEEMRLLDRLRLLQADDADRRLADLRPD